MTALSEIVTLRLLGSLKPDTALHQLPTQKLMHGYYFIRCPFSRKLHWACLAHPFTDADWSVLADLDAWHIEPNLELVLATWHNWRELVQQTKWSKWNGRLQH